MDDKRNILETIKIFDNYPPLTSRLICQLEFMKNCLNNNTLINFTENRNNKYLNQSKLIDKYANLTIPLYFSG
jgi:hypothetical protein